MAGHALSISVISVEAGLAGLKAKIIKKPGAPLRACQEIASSSNQGQSQSLNGLSRRAAPHRLVAVAFLRSLPPSAGPTEDGSFPSISHIGQTPSSDVLASPLDIPPICAKGLIIFEQPKSALLPGRQRGGPKTL